MSTRRFHVAMSIYAALGILSATTLEGKIRWATLIFLGGLALKTWLSVLRDRAE
jgi:hypothetical protein